MLFEKSIEIFDKILNVNNDFLKKEFLEKAMEYARIRADWYFMENENRVELDKSRSIKHNAFIDSINANSRFMAKNNEDNSWFNDFPDPESFAGRKTWGDFACFVHFQLGILMR